MKLTPLRQKKIMPLGKLTGLILVASSLTTAAYAQSPSLPGNLSLAVYSNTSAEIFWDRSTDNSLVIGYEIQVNGEPVIVRDATSYYASSFIAGEPYTLGVTAIDNEGNRSSTTQVSFIGGERQSVTMAPEGGLPVVEPPATEPPTTEPPTTEPPVIQPPTTQPPANEPPVADNAPTSPTGVNAAIYSRRTFEIFWDRVTSELIEYDIFIDSVLLDTTFGTSTTARNLTAGTEYTVDVVAIDILGNRSIASSISVLTPGERQTVSPTVVPPEDNVTQPENTTKPPAPQNPLLAVYSRSSGELFWDRAPSVDAVVNNEIKRDGVLLGNTNGTSFFDSTRVTGVDHRYEIVAINSSGARSDSSIIGGTTDTNPPDDSDATGDDSDETISEEDIDSGDVIDEDTTEEDAIDDEIIVDTTDDATTEEDAIDNEIIEDTTDDDTTEEDVIDDDITEDNTDEDTSEIDESDEEVTDEVTDITPPVSAFVPDESDLVDADAFYDEDGYDTVDVIRIDLRTETTAGICTIDDQSGCTLDDLIADVDPDDDFKVEIAVHMQGADFPDDGSTSNATLRQRGGTARSFPQKSFRIKLDSKKDLWRNERRLQLNKHANERDRIRNKLAFDLMRELPHLPSLRTQFVNLWIDDGAGPEDYGLFTHVEFAGKEYLVNRDLNDDDRVYKVEFLKFSQGDLNNIQVDEDGDPIDEDRFESRLEIERGKDHTVVAQMLTAMLDPEQSFESVFDRYFNRNNVITWMTANILLYQTDAVTHNYYLYNPVGSEKIYFMPWDYDGTFHPDSILTNSYDFNELSKRLYYGYARNSNNDFIASFLKMPGIHEEIVAAANELRNTYLTDSNIMERAERYASVVAPFLTQDPDITFNPRYSLNGAQEFVKNVAGIHEALQTSYDIPMPHKLNAPELTTEGMVLFSWTPAFDVTRKNELSYDIEIAGSPNFSDDNILIFEEGIGDDDTLVEYVVDSSTLPPGTLYYRVTARGDTDPLNVWQIGSNTLTVGDSTFFGVVDFELP